MNILVTGSNGQLGLEMRIVSNSSNNNYYFSDVVDSPGVNTIRLDITRINDIRKTVRDNKIRAIINCAAFTDVDAAENNEVVAELINAKAVENLAIVMREVNGLLVHISTDYVFGGDPYNTPCKENQRVTPIGVYGLTKLHGEQAIIKVGCRHVIIRTSWLYSEFGKNFVKTMLNLMSSKSQLKVVFDQVGTPTYAFDLANVIYSIVENKMESISSCIYHYSNEGVCSWFDFAKMIADYTGNDNCEILPCHSDEYLSKVKRPAYSVLDKTMIKENLGIVIPYWADSLKNCLANLGVLSNKYLS